MKITKSRIAEAFTLVLTAAVLMSAVPAKSASYSYVQTYYKSEAWNDDSEKWEPVEERKTTLGANGKEKKVYERSAVYNVNSNSYHWERASAWKNTYNADGTLKQRKLYSDIKFKNYTGKSVYTYEKKGKKRVLSKITNYNESGMMTEVISYTRNSKGQVTREAATDHNNAWKSLRTFKYDNKGRLKSERYERSGSWETWTYKNGLLVKNEYKNTEEGGASSITTYRYNKKKQLVEMTEKYTPRWGVGKVSYTTCYSGYDAHGNYTKRTYSRTGPVGGSYTKVATTTTEYIHTYQYDKNGNVIRELVTGKDEDSYDYSKDHRYTYTYKKVKAG